MPDALIGFSGFVGQTLLRQRAFDDLYRSTNIGTIDGRAFGTVVCAGAPAQKWLANRDPEDDRRKIDALIERLDTIDCRHFTLISTVDVFGRPVGVDEASEVDENGLHAYGLNRRRLEQFVASRFDDHLIVRLPGLVGPRLRKNVIFDLLNGNNLHAIDGRAQFQFYPMVNLSHDLELARAARLKLVHLTAEPLVVADIAKQAFGMSLDRAPEGAAARYDMRSLHAQVFGPAQHFQYSARETMLAIRAYAQSEPTASAAKSVDDLVHAGAAS